MNKRFDTKCGGLALTTEYMMRGRRTSPDTGVGSFAASGGGGGSSDAGESSSRGGGGDLVLVDWVVGSCSGDGEVLEDWNAGSGSLTSRTSSEVSVERLEFSSVCEFWLCSLEVLFVMFGDQADRR